MSHTLDHFTQQVRETIPRATFSPNQVGDVIEFRVIGHPDIEPFTQPIDRLHDLSQGNHPAAEGLTPDKAPAAEHAKQGIANVDLETLVQDAAPAIAAGLAVALLMGGS